MENNLGTLFWVNLQLQEMAISRSRLFFLEKKKQVNLCFKPLPQLENVFVKDNIYNLKTKNAVKKPIELWVPKEEF